MLIKFSLLRHVSVQQVRQQDDVVYFTLVFSLSREAEEDSVWSMRFGSFSLERRYSQLREWHENVGCNSLIIRCANRKKLVVPHCKNYELQVPNFPPKTLIKKTSRNFLLKRKQALELWLQ
jgi:hypothetical protein